MRICDKCREPAQHIVTINNIESFDLCKQCNDLVREMLAGDLEDKSETDSTPSRRGRGRPPKTKD